MSNSISDSIRLGKAKQHILFGNSKYIFHESPAETWENSNQHCREETGGELVSIESKKEWEFLNNTIQSMISNEYFIGLKKDSKSGEWRWISDNSKVNASKGKFPWAKDQPSGDGHCAVMYRKFGGNLGKFNDLHCAHRQPHICESSADSTVQEGMFNYTRYFLFHLTY